MARKAAKCAECGDLLWFGDNDRPPQRVQCPCNKTALTEAGPEGSFSPIVAADLEEIARLESI